ncbi:MAG: HAD family phosphatase [Clostridia bacterium]|nr:HAD family phosphatase [Clostridia bacterium]
MTPNPIRLIATDIDGTLLDSRLQIPERNLRAIHAAREKGIPVAISSGRFPENVYVLLEDYGLRCPIIGTNGADIIDENLNRLSETSIAPESALRVLEQLIRLGSDYFMFAAKAICTSRDTLKHHSELSFSDRIRALGFTYCYGPKEAAALAECGITHKFFVRDNVPLPLVREALSGIPGIDLTQSSTNNVEVMPLGVDKGVGVRTLADSLKIPLSQVMAIGDEGNDIPMLRAAGYGVAMENGCAEAKAAAKYITDTNNNCGFAKAIEQYAL